MSAVLDAIKSGSFQLRSSAQAMAAEKGAGAGVGIGAGRSPSPRLPATPGAARAGGVGRQGEGDAGGQQPGTSSVLAAGLWPAVAAVAAVAAKPLTPQQAMLQRALSLRAAMASGGSSGDEDD